MTKKENKKESSTKTIEETKSCCSNNVWMFVSIGLGVAFTIALFFAILNVTGQKESNISPEQAGIGLVNLINTLQPDSNTVLLKSEEVSGLYKITVKSNNQTGEIYVTKDGKYVIPGVIDVNTLTKTNTTKNETSNSETNKIYTLPNIENIPRMGNENAKIQIYEFSDFQCPWCGMAFGSPWTEQYKTSQYAPIIGTVKKIEQLAKEGKILFLQFPVAINTANNSTESIDASNAAFCASDQNKFWEMHDALFNAQDSEKEYTGKFAKDKLKIIASKIEGLDLDKFNDCLDKDTYVSRVKSMTQSVAQVAYNNTSQFGTPTFYIVVDASLGKEKIESIAKAQGYKVGPTDNSNKYLILADPFYEKIEAVVNGLSK